MRNEEKDMQVSSVTFLSRAAISSGLKMPSFPVLIDEPPVLKSKNRDDWWSGMIELKALHLTLLAVKINGVDKNDKKNLLILHWSRGHGESDGLEVPSWRPGPHRSPQPPHLSFISMFRQPLFDSLSVTPSGKSLQDEGANCNFPEIAYKNHLQWRAVINIKMWLIICMRMCGYILVYTVAKLRGVRPKDNRIISHVKCAGYLSSWLVSNNKPKKTFLLFGWIPTQYWKYQGSPVVILRIRVANVPIFQFELLRLDYELEKECFLCVTRSCFSPNMFSALCTKNIFFYGT